MRRVRQNSALTTKNRPAAFRRMIPELPALLRARQQRRDRLDAWVGELQAQYRYIDLTPTWAWIKKQNQHAHSSNVCPSCYRWHVKGVCVVPPKKYRRTVPLAVRAWIYDRDEYRCRYCGREGDRSSPRFDPAGITIDHVTPWPLRPSSDPWDLVTACLGCNMRKKDTFWVPIPRTHDALQAVLAGGRH